MKNKILDIVAEHCVGWNDCEELTNKLLRLFEGPSDDELAKKGLTVKPFAYDIHQLRENGEYLMEGSRRECLDRAEEILAK